MGIRWPTTNYGIASNFRARLIFEFWILNRKTSLLSELSLDFAISSKRKSSSTYGLTVIWTWSSLWVHSGHRFTINLSILSITALISVTRAQNCVGLCQPSTKLSLYSLPSSQMPTSGLKIFKPQTIAKSLR